MRENDEIIDFAFTDDVVKLLSRIMGFEECEIVRIFWPRYYLFRMYRLIHLIFNKKHTPEDYEKMRMFHVEVEADLPLYYLIHAIMLNKLKRVRTILGKVEIELDRDLSKTAVAWMLERGRWHVMYGHTLLGIAAILGRIEIFKLLIDQGADPGKLVILSGMYPGPISLSVNECLMMNEMYHWTKAERKEKLSASRVNVLIDAVILASKKSPSIVADSRLEEPTVRISMYWSALKKMAGDDDLLKRLIPLNPEAIKEIFDIY